jgi:hypothetical protein
LPLPPKGILYFFIGLPEPADNVYHEVRFWPGDTDRLGQHPAPLPSAVLDAQTIAELQPTALTFEPGLSFDPARIDDLKVDCYSYLCRAVDGPPTHQSRLLGFASCPLGVEERQWWAAARAKADPGHNGSAVAALDGSLLDAQLLLEVASHDDAGMGWWDAGALQFWILREDLARLDFSRTHCCIATS